jgi:hypothetical protein
MAVTRPFGVLCDFSFAALYRRPGAQSQRDQDSASLRVRGD